MYEKLENVNDCYRKDLQVLRYSGDTSFTRLIENTKELLYCVFTTVPDNKLLHLYLDNSVANSPVLHSSFNTFTLSSKDISWEHIRNSLDRKINASSKFSVAGYDSRNYV